MKKPEKMSNKEYEQHIHDKFINEHKAILLTRDYIFNNGVIEAGKVMFGNVCKDCINVQFNHNCGGSLPLTLPHKVLEFDECTPEQKKQLEIVAWNIAGKALLFRPKPIKKKFDAYKLLVFWIFFYSGFNIIGFFIYHLWFMMFIEILVFIVSLFLVFRILKH